MKYLGIKLLKEAKKLNSEKYKILIKAIKVHKQMKRYTMFFDWKNQYCENNYTTQRNLQIQCNSIKLPMPFFTELGMCLETQNALSSQSKPEKEKQR